MIHHVWDYTCGIHHHRPEQQTEALDSSLFLCGPVDPTATCALSELRSLSQLCFHLAGSYFALDSRLSLKYCGLGGGTLSFTTGLTQAWAPDQITLALYGPLAYTAAAGLARGILGGSMYGTGRCGAPVNAMEQARIAQVRSTLAELSAHAHLMPVQKQRKKIVKLAALLKLLEAGHPSAVPGNASSSGSGSSDNNPAQGRGAPTGPGQSGGSSLGPGQSGGSSLGPGQSGGSSLGSGQSGGSSLGLGQSAFRLVQPGGSAGPGPVSTAAGHMRFSAQHTQSCYSQTSAASQAFPCIVTSSDEDDGDKLMFVARVLCGRTTRGSPSMRKPPADQSDPSGRPFNSTCDYERKPALYVVYDSAQAYPEYVVSFSSSL